MAIMNKITSILFLVFLIFGVVFFTGCKKDPVPPTITTATVTDITLHTATSGGSVTKDGGAAVTARGICWSTAELPSVRDSHTTDNKGTGSFTSDITDLSPNTIYHVRAYATNKVGTSYGNDISFTTIPIVLASLSTTTVTGITLTTAISGGNITADGGGAITARGVCWATTVNPIIGATNTTTDGTGYRSFHK